MKEFSRTVTTSIIKTVQVTFDNDGKPKMKQLEDLEIIGEEVDRDKATKIVKKMGKEGVIVKDVIIDTAIYTMPLDTFLNYATKVEPEAEPKTGE